MAFDLTNIKREQNETSSFTLDNLLKKEIHPFGSPFNNKIKEDFYTELAVLLKAGIQLKKALDLICDSQKKKAVKAVLESISDGVVSGKSLSEILQNQKEFTAYEYHTLKIGEETGNLALVAEQLGSFYTRKNNQRRNLISALTYPIIILCTAVLVVIFMLSYVVPMFQDIFLQQNVELPGITKLIISCSEFIANYGMFMLLALILLFVFRRFLSKKPWFKSAKDNLILKLPFIGEFVRMVYLAQFTGAVSLLTASRVPVVNSIQLVKKMLDFYPLQKALDKTEHNIIQGKSLSDSLKDHSLFDSKMIALVKVAEETNQTEFIFKRLNNQYSTQVEQRSKMLSTIMEPFIILVIGSVVGIILIAMYLPMFRLSSVLG